MTVPFVVPLYGAIFALIFIGLTIRIIALRASRRITLGSGGDPTLERAVRAHGNFIEFVPLALILLIAMEAQRNSIYVLHALCLVLLVGRLCHIVGISQAKDANALRGLGMVLTMAVLAIAAVILIYDYFRIAAIG